MRRMRRLPAARAHGAGQPGLTAGRASTAVIGVGALLAAAGAVLTVSLLATIVLTSAIEPAGAATVRTITAASAAGAVSRSATAGAPGGTVASVVPSTATPGSRVTFAVSCASPNTASATLSGQILGLPNQIPMDAGAASGDFTITVTLPMHIQPATYRPQIDCADGTSTTAALTVTPFPAAGGAQTGDGTTSTTRNTGLTAGGVLLIGIGLAAGTLAVVRRRRA